MKELVYIITCLAFYYCLRFLGNSIINFIGSKYTYYIIQREKYGKYGLFKIDMMFLGKI